MHSSQEVQHFKNSNNIQGGSGIGRATALAFAEKKVKVAVVDLVNAQKTVDLIKQKGGTAIAIKADVSIAKGILCNKNHHVYCRC